MSRAKKADFKIDDVIVTIACPYCQAQQRPPTYPNSYGWDRKYINRVATKGEITCGKCGKKFELPVTLINL